MYTSIAINIIQYIASHIKFYGNAITPTDVGPTAVSPVHNNLVVIISTAVIGFFVIFVILVIIITFSIRHWRRKR